MHFLLKLIIFLFFNFLALGIGGMYTAKAVTAPWYMSLNKAPWTPPGWVFGAAWTTIMIAFSFYMALILPAFDSSIFKSILIIYILQWILNVIWNPIFFKYEQTAVGLIVIIALSLVVYYLTYYAITLNNKYVLICILPYAIWMTIASSLNAYVVIKN